MLGMAREFECRCGHVARGADDEELFAAIREHADEKHPEMGMTDERINEGIRTMARDAD